MQSLFNCKKMQLLQIVSVLVLTAHVAIYFVIAQFKTAEYGFEEIDSKLDTDIEVNGYIKSNVLDDTNINDSDNFDKELELFEKNYPGYNKDIDEIAQKELTRFGDDVYADYTGSGVYQSSQLDNIFDDLKNNAYGNAHSTNPSANLTDSKLFELRNRILKFFKADGKNKFHVIFTSGATGALKMVGEDFPWTPESLFWYLRINHNSLLGIREYVTYKGASFKALSTDDIKSIIRQRADMGLKNDLNSSVKCLFAYPLKDNFAGQFYPESWTNDIQTYGLSDGCRWHVLVDAAAYAATSQMDLDTYPSDFTAISFYKMFGYPTGVGVLLVRDEDVDTFQKVYWGGGSVVAAVCDTRWCKSKSNPSMRFEDGTVAFLSIVELSYGFDKLEEFGLDRISSHVGSLTQYMADRLDELFHVSGTPVIERYSDKLQPQVGGIVNLNVLTSDGGYVNFAEVEVKASAKGIHLRAGCFCNPGGCQDYLNLTQSEMIKGSQNRQKCGDKPQDAKVQKALGSVRVSIGYLSTFKDVYRIVQFFKDFS